MGIKTWSYDPEKCDGDYCPCNCYICSKAEVTEDKMPIEMYMAMLNEMINGKDDNERD